MIEAFVVTLREGVEAALAIVLILACLRKAGKLDLARPVYRGMAVGVLLSVAAGIAIKMTGFDPEGRAEGIVLAVSAVLVLSLVIWMWAHGKKLRQDTEQKVGEILGRSGPGQKTGLFLFSFFVIFREGAETVLMLSAVQFTTDSVLTAAGGLLGLVLAIAFGVAFYRGSIKVDLRKFFTVTTIVLVILVVQLTLSSLHEFAEAGDLSFGPDYMRIAGPLLRNNVFFVIAVLLLPFFLLMRSALKTSAPANPAEQRKEMAMARTQRVARVVVATIAIVTIGMLGWTYAQEKGELKMEPPVPVEAFEGNVYIPVADLADRKLHRYGIGIDKVVVRFLAIQDEKGKVTTTFDACQICKDSGYVMVGERLICLNCTADINPASLGESGGCNPIPLECEIRSGQVVVSVAKLATQKAMFTKDYTVSCPVCRMQFKLSDAAGAMNGQPLCPMKECREELQKRR